MELLSLPCKNPINPLVRHISGHNEVIHARTSVKDQVPCIRGIVRSSPYWDGFPAVDSFVLKCYLRDKILAEGLQLTLACHHTMVSAAL